MAETRTGNASKFYLEAADRAHRYLELLKKIYHEVTRGDGDIDTIRWDIEKGVPEVMDELGSK